MPMTEEHLHENGRTGNNTTRRTRLLNHLERGGEHSSFRQNDSASELLKEKLWGQSVLSLVLNRVLSQSRTDVTLEGAPNLLLAPVNTGSPTGLHIPGQKGGSLCSSPCAGQFIPQQLLGPQQIAVEAVLVGMG